MNDDAETIALLALGWIAGEADMLARFLAASGLTPGDLQARLSRPAAEPEFLGSVLDFLLQEDAWVVAFCRAAGLGCERPLKARAALPGTDPGDW